MRMRSIRTMTLSASLAVVLVACGPKKVARSAELSNFKFTPSTLEAPPGADVTLTLTNNAPVLHQWRVMMLGTQAELPFDTGDEANVYFTAEVQPGTTQTFTFTAPSDPGDYEVICGLPGHAEAGMVGTLTVR